MTDFARALISKVIEQQDVTTPLRAGIKLSWFENETQQEAMQWILDHLDRYAKSPTRRAFSAQFPTYRFLNVPEPFEYYIDQFREARKRVILVDTVIAADKALKTGKIKDAAEILSNGQLRLGKEVSSLSDEDAVETLNERISEYKDLRENYGKLRGVSTGFPTLDYVSGGFRPQQFVLIGGLPKQGKSFILMRMAVAAHDAGMTVLFISFEMSKFEQLCRYDAITCGIDSNRLLFGKMNANDEVSLFKGMRRRQDMKPFIISTDIAASTTMSGIAAKIDQYQPDIVFIDGIYLMENEIGAEPLSTMAYTAISRSAKRLAQRSNIPLVGTTQALSGKMPRSGKVTLHSFGWTSAWSQDSDLLLGASSVEEAPLINLQVVAGRNTSPTEIAVQCDWDTCTIEEVTEEDDDDSQEGDDREYSSNSRHRSDDNKREHRRSLPVSRGSSSKLLDSRSDRKLEVLAVSKSGRLETTDRGGRDRQSRRFERNGTAPRGSISSGWPEEK